ncbi:MAG TPA: ankyrin repeat domain-containing protein [Steroidobacteraceae bacterium]|nr:ankyrin repeat domain-containing protein [Steroidobacteraceae bacterium]
MRWWGLSLMVLGCSLACASDKVSVASGIAPPPLIAAIRAHDSSKALELIAAQPRLDVNQRSVDGTTALHWAVYNDEVAVIERLLAAGANPNVRNDYNATPLAEAAVIGNPMVIQKLLKAGADPEAANADGQTALMVLARSSNIEAAKLLLKAGAAVNAHETWRGQTALMWAAAQAQPQMVQLLIEYGADVNAVSKLTNFERQVTAEPRMQQRPSGGLTPLLYAARSGCVECAKELVRGGADINLPDPDGITPLIMAGINASFDVGAFLVTKGAELNVWDTWGRSPLYAVVDLNTVPTGGRADRPSADATTGTELVKMMLEHGANPNLQIKIVPPLRSLRDDRGPDAVLQAGTTPLARAAKGGDVEVVRLLLVHGANASLPTVQGVTPMMMAAGTEYSGRDSRGRYQTDEQAAQIIQLLLGAGADINARAVDGGTALHGAASRGRNAIVNLLVAHNADPAIKDARGRTAADVANGVGGGAFGRAPETYPETAALLKKLMADTGTRGGAR